MIESENFALYFFKNQIELNSNYFDQYLRVNYKDIDELIKLLQEAKIQKQFEELEE